MAGHRTDGDPSSTSIPAPFRAHADRTIAGTIGRFRTRSLRHHRSRIERSTRALQQEDPASSASALPRDALHLGWWRSARCGACRAPSTRVGRSWRRGRVAEAGACKALHVGSIPTDASTRTGSRPIGRDPVLVEASVGIEPTWRALQAPASATRPRRHERPTLVLGARHAPQRALRHHPRCSASRGRADALLAGSSCWSARVDRSMRLR